jgi:phosphoacetylglucosamine mutase
MVMMEIGSMIKTNDNETKVLAPASLQKALDAACHGSAEARCFVRPSGTENAVRIYAEAATQRQADDLASEAVIVVQRICGGTNPSPTIVSKL